MKLDSFYFENSYSKQTWLMEMKYLTSFAEINEMPCFDFDYIFKVVYQDEEERQKQQKEDLQ